MQLQKIKMLRPQGGFFVCLALFFGVFALISGLIISTELDMDYQANACPNLEQLVMGTLSAVILTDPTTPTALLRLLFHDCQVQVSLWEL